MHGYKSFREKISWYAFRGFVALSAATPVVAVFQGYHLLSDFRKNHRDAPFPDMPCSGVVVVHPLPQDTPKTNILPSMPRRTSTSSWFSSFPLLAEQQDPNPLRLLVVGDSLAAGVGVTKSGTPVLPEAIAKTLSSALGGRAVYWTCMGEPGLSSPQIVKELLLDSDENAGEEKQVDVMKELKEWWDYRRQQQQQNGGTGEDLNPNEVPENIRAWWRRVRVDAQKDLNDLKERLRLSEKLPEPAVVLPRRRNTVVPELVAKYDVAVVITGFNDLKNLIFSGGGADPDHAEQTRIKKRKGTGEEDDVSSNAWLEKDLLSIMRALKGKMRNYGIANSEDTKTDTTVNRTESDSASSAPSTKDDGVGDAPSSLAAPPLRHHPMVVFPATPLFAEKIYPLSWFAAPGVKVSDLFLAMTQTCKSDH